LLPLSATFCVDHGHEVAGVDVRREDRLVLPAQQRRHLAGQAAEHDIEASMTCH
jgi:hypothetical protein